MIFFWANIFSGPMIDCVSFLSMELIRSQLGSNDGRQGTSRCWKIHFWTKMTLSQGCQIFLGATYQNEEKITKWHKHIPNGHETYKTVEKILQMATKYTIVLYLKRLQNKPK
jgi:hypothetical protein